MPGIMSNITSKIPPTPTPFWPTEMIIKNAFCLTYNSWRKPQTTNHLSTGVRELADNDVSNALFLTLANTQAGSRFDLDQLRLAPPLVQHIITERITQDLSTQHTYGEVVSHWFTACTAIDQLRAANEELATIMHLDTNLKNIKTFTISYLKFIGKL